MDDKFDVTRRGIEKFTYKDEYEDVLEVERDGVDQFWLTINDKDCVKLTYENAKRFTELLTEMIR